MNTQDLPEPYDQSTPGIPHHPKKRTLPWCQGWLGLVIGSFRSVGGVVDMPRVPDGRAGVYNRAGLLGGLGAPVNNCQQCRKQPSRVRTRCWAG